LITLRRLKQDSAFINHSSTPSHINEEKGLSS